MRFFRFAALMLGIVTMAVPANAAICAPPKLVHIVMSADTAGLDAAAFGAQPRTYYRIGNDKMRIEEAPDKPNGVHGLIVVAEPNIWMINLFDKTARHIVDPGPTLIAVAPVIALSGMPAKLAALQLGCEGEFLAANAIAPTRTEHIANADFTVYRISDAGDAIELLERQGTTTPAYARYYRQGKLDLVLRYDVYEVGLPDDPSLFIPPGDVQMTEAAGH